MKRVGSWILGAAVGSFVAGICVGLVAPDIVSAANDVTTPDDVYVAEMVATYGLRADQERRLRLVLQAARDEEIAVLKSAEAAQLPQPIQARLLNVRRQMEKRVRKLLDAEQLARYEEASRPNETR